MAKSRDERMNRYPCVTCGGEKFRKDIEGHLKTHPGFFCKRCKRIVPPGHVCYEIALFDDAVWLSQLLESHGLFSDVLSDSSSDEA